MELHIFVSVMRGRISFKSGAVQHLYQRTNDGFLIFYSVRDYLVFFTILTTAARRYNVRILGVCLMVDHIHILVEAPNKMELDQFVCLYTSWFVKTYNEWYGRKGPFFQKQYGIASKVYDKDIRNAIAYLYNNPVERQICQRAEQARWNLLAYGNCRHPFSQPLRLDKARAPIRRAVEEIRSSRKEGRPLNYAQLKRISKSLLPEEQAQLTDFIVSCYNCVDYPDLFYRFGSYDKLVTAINTTTGSEYAISEEFVGRSDRIYSQMSRFLLDSHKIDVIDDLLRLPDDQRRELLEPLNIRTGASRRQLEKYLHLHPEQPTQP